MKKNFQKAEISKEAVEEVKSAIADLKKVKSNKGVYEKLLSSKFLAATVIPIALMGFVIPKLIFGLTAKTKAAKRAKAEQKTQLNNAAKFSNPPFTLLKSDVFTPLSLKNSKNRHLPEVSLQ